MFRGGDKEAMKVKQERFLKAWLDTISSIQHTSCYFGNGEVQVCGFGMLDNTCVLYVLLLGTRAGVSSEHTFSNCSKMHRTSKSIDVFGSFWSSGQLWEHVCVY